MKLRGNTKFLDLTMVDSFTCNHVKGTFDWGSHPKRIFTYCAECKTVSMLKWHDPYGRLTNRIIGSMPALFTAISVIVVIATFIYFLLPIGTHP